MQFFREFASTKGSQQVFSRARPSHSCEVLIVSGPPNGGCTVGVSELHPPPRKADMCYLKRNSSTEDCPSLIFIFVNPRQFQLTAQFQHFSWRFRLFAKSDPDAIPIRSVSHLVFTTCRHSSQDRQWCIKSEEKEWENSRGYGKKHRWVSYINPNTDEPRWFSGRKDWWQNIFVRTYCANGPFSNQGNIEDILITPVVVFSPEAKPGSFPVWYLALSYFTEWLSNWC